MSSTFWVPQTVVISHPTGSVQYFINLAAKGISIDMNIEHIHENGNASNRLAAQTEFSRRNHLGDMGNPAAIPELMIIVPSPELGFGIKN